MEGAAEPVAGTRVTRAREKKRRLDEGIPEDPPKPKIQTLGKYLADEREKIATELQQDEDVADYEQFANYEKNDVLARLNAQAVDKFKGQLYSTGEEHKGTRLVFLTFATGEHPKNFTHICNNTTIKWNLQDLKISSSHYHFGLPDVAMVFVRGKHVEGTTAIGNMYKYLGLVGLQSISSGSGDGSYTSESYIYLQATFVFDYVLTKKELALFGNNIMKCKKNKYGSSLCN